MRKLIISTTLLYLLTCGYSFSNPSDSGKLSVKTDPNGFKGINWGTDISLISNLEKTNTQAVPVASSQEEIGACYKKKDENLSYMGVFFEKIEYCFWKDKLFSISATTVDFENANKLKKTFEKKFGKAIQTIGVPHGPRFIFDWAGHKTKISLTCTKNTHPFSGPGVLFMQSKAIEKEMERTYQ